MKMTEFIILFLDIVLGLSGIISCVFLIIIFIKNLILKRKILKPLAFIVLLASLMSFSITRELVIIVFSIIVFLHGFFWLLYSIRQLFVKERNADYETEQYPHVAVLIPVKNEQSVILETVESVLALDYPGEKLQTIIIDDHSTDNTVRILSEHCEQKSIRILTNQGTPGKAGSLNYALKNISADFIIILDADHQIRRDFLKAGLIHFEDKKVGCVQGKTIIRNSYKSVVSILVEMDTLLNYEVLLAGKKCPNFSGSGAIFDINALKKVGLFCEKTITEDMEMSYKLYQNGYKTIYNKRLVTTSLAPLKYMSLYKQRYRWFSGLIQIWFINLIPILKSKLLNFFQKMDIIQNGLGVLTLKCMFVLNTVLITKWLGLNLTSNYIFIRFILYFMILVIVLGVFLAFIRARKKLYLFVLTLFSPFVYIILYLPAVAIVINKYVFDKKDRWFPTIRE